MKIFLFLPLALAACATVPDQGRIVTEAQFRAAIVGKTIQLQPGVTFRINPDNTISGDVDGQAATGTWAFEDGFWCRSITLGEVVSEDCQLWEIDGDRLRITRERGAGDSFTWRRPPS